MITSTRKENEQALTGRAVPTLTHFLHGVLHGQTVPVRADEKFVHSGGKHTSQDRAHPVHLKYIDSTPQTPIDSKPEIHRQYTSNTHRQYT